MKPAARFFLFFLIFLTSLFSFAQTNPSSKNTAGSTGNDENSTESNTSQNDSLLNIGNPKNVKIYMPFTKQIRFKELKNIDTTLHAVDMYNPSKQNNTFTQDLGIIGSAGKPLIFDFAASKPSELGFHAFDAYIREPFEVELIETNTPFTQLSYLMGSKKENVLRVQHAQSFRDKQIKAGIDFKLFNTIGYYARQKTDIKNFSGNIAYKTKDNRYSVEGIYLHNKLVIQENGGIVFDSLYEQNLEANRQIISINLPTAENLIKYDGIGFRQNLYLAKAEPDFSSIPDTNLIKYTGYSVQHFKKPFFDPIAPLGKLEHTFIYSNELYYYSDTDGASAFYSSLPNFPIGITQISDSISHRIIKNSILYSNADYKDSRDFSKFFYYSFGIEFNALRFEQDSMTNTFTELNPMLNAELLFSKNIYFSASGNYSFRNDKSTSYSLNAELDFLIELSKLTFSVKTNSTQAPWIFQSFNNSYFKWENNFNNQRVFEFQTNFTRKHTAIKAVASLLWNHLYFDELILPKQCNSAITLISLHGHQDVQLGKFGIDLNLTYQYTSNKNIIRIPEFYTFTKFFYTNTLFKKATTIELGIAIRYFTNFYSATYMPALRSFYLQNSISIGNYPYVDLYLDAKIKRARLFVKYEQVNAAYMPLNYFASPHYPNPDPSFKFGFIWQLFN
jgi:hypothetical protein